MADIQWPTSKSRSTRTSIYMTYILGEAQDCFLWVLVQVQCCTRKATIGRRIYSPSFALGWLFLFYANGLDPSVTFCANARKTMYKDPSISLPSRHSLFFYYSLYRLCSSPLSSLSFWLLLAQSPRTSVRPTVNGCEGAYHLSLLLAEEHPSVRHWLAFEIS